MNKTRSLRELLEKIIKENTRMNLDDIEKKAKAATPGPWANKWSSNYPFYVDVRKPAPSLSKHDAERPTYWRVQDAEYIAAVSPDVVLKLIERLRDAEETIEWPTESALKAYKKKWSAERSESDVEGTEGD